MVKRVFILHAVSHINKSLCLENAQGRIITRVKHGEVLPWFGQQCRGILLVPLLSFMAEFLQMDYVGKLGNQAYLMVQKLFSNNDAIFQDNDAPIHTAEKVGSLFGEHEDEFHHLPCQPA
jgi:hypothetical protein